MYPDTEEMRDRNMPTEKKKELFARTVREREKALYRVAFVMLRNTADAEDAVAEGAEAAYRRLDYLRDERALPAYLMRCTVNACHNVLRRKKREVVVEACEIYMPATYPELPVWTYLMGLEQKYRVPIAMRYGEDMSIQEIAQALRIPQGTVSTRISRGLKLLRSQLER